MGLDKINVTWIVSGDNYVENNMEKKDNLSKNVLKWNDFLSKSNQFDIILEIGQCLSNYNILQMKKINPHIKLVLIQYGNTFILDIEQILFNKEYKYTHCNNSGHKDQVWYSPHHKNNKEYLKSIFNCEALVCPYIWEPYNIKKPFLLKDYNESKMNIYIMEPNINIVKTSLIPICIVDRLWKKNPNCFNKCYVITNEKIQDTNYFKNNILKQLTSVHGKQNKFYFCDRAIFNDVFKKPGVLLSHQMHNALNYLHLEALYCRVPLVHNSEFLQEDSVGYFYEKNNIENGAKMLEIALKSGIPPDYSNYLHKYSINNKINQTGYLSLIDEIVNQ